MSLFSVRVIIYLHGAVPVAPGGVITQSSAFDHIGHSCDERSSSQTGPYQLCDGATRNANFCAREGIEVAQ